MRYSENILCALDVGASKICCMIANREDSGVLRILGTGHHSSSGFKNGIISDMRAAEDSIKMAVSIAEKDAEVKVDSVVLGITIGKTESKILTSEIEIEGPVVTEDDIRKVSLTGRESVLRNNNSVIHELLVGFSLDGMKGIIDPRDMFGRNLSIDLHQVSVFSDPLKTLTTCITSSDINIDHLVISAYAAGLSTLSEDEKKLGSVVLDIGSSTTSLAIFHEGEMVYTEAFNDGGEYLTIDIAKEFSISLEEAERVKVMHARAISGPEDSNALLELPPIGNFSDEQPILIKRANVVKIVRSRLINLFESVKGIIERSGFSSVIARRIVLTGGTSEIDGVSQIANEILNFKPRIGRPTDILALTDEVRTPAFAVVCGLLNFTHNYKLSKKLDSLFLYKKKEKSKLVSFKTWIKENF